MSRGHVQGFDSNAEQFARMGNPWVGEPVLRKAGNKRGRKYPKPCRPGFPRCPDRDSRTDCEAFERAKESQRIALLVQAFKGNCRTAAPLEDGQKSPTLAILPARATELTGWTRLERQVRRIQQRAAFEAKEAVAKAAWDASEAGKAEQRRRIAARIAALELQLSSL